MARHHLLNIFLPVSSRNLSRPVDVWRRKLISGSHLARSVLLNLLGTGVPLLAAIVSIPLLIDGLGTARFGVLTIAWSVVGYFSLFDMGLGRALTKLVAERLGTARFNEIAPLVWTAMMLMAILGMLGALVVAVLSPWLVRVVLKIPLELQAEALVAFYLLAGSIPIVISAAGLRGILEAHQRFGLVNVVRVPLGIATFLGPLAVLPFSTSLIPVVGVLVVARMVALSVQFWMCLRVAPQLRTVTRIDYAMVRLLLRFGSWMTVSNIVGPLMAYMDRFLIGATTSMTAVAYYATPYEIVTKLWIIPGALMGVLFPAFASTFAQDPARAARLLARGVNYIFISLFPLVLAIVTFGYEGLALWLGKDFADNSALVLQLLAVGVFINCLSQPAFGLLQSAGRPDLTAKLHLFELPFYLGSLWWVLGTNGIVGAAMVWMVRVTVDTAVLFGMVHWLLPERTLFTWRMQSMAAGALAALVVGALLSGTLIKGVFLLLVVLVFMLTAWFFVFDDVDRALICKQAKVPQVN